MTCTYCKGHIDQDRLEFLAEYKKPMVCVECSTEQRVVGYMDWEHKTAPQLVMVASNAKETIRILDRANRRAR